MQLFVLIKKLEYHSGDVKIWSEKKGLVPVIFRLFKLLVIFDSIEYVATERGCVIVSSGELELADFGTYRKDSN